MLVTVSGFSEKHWSTHHLERQVPTWHGPLLALLLVIICGSSRPECWPVPVSFKQEMSVLSLCALTFATHCRSGEQCRSHFRTHLHPRRRLSTEYEINDAALLSCVKKHGGKDWHLIARELAAQPLLQTSTSDAGASQPQVTLPVVSIDSGQGEGEGKRMGSASTSGGQGEASGVNPLIPAWKLMQHYYMLQSKAGKLRLADWDPADDEVLLRAVDRHGRRKWLVRN